jgi:hypothetical protein
MLGKNGIKVFDHIFLHKFTLKFLGDHSLTPCIQGLSELADQNNTVKTSSSGNNSKNILKNSSSLDFKIRTFLIDQSRVDIKLP